MMKVVPVARHRKASGVNLYLDVDGVLLGRESGGGHEVVLARHAAEFMDFALRQFDCYWLTTHCDGTGESVLRYLRPYYPSDFLERLAAVRPTRFTTLKTEALQGDFYWLEDSPLQAEIDWLAARGLLARWIGVNARKDPAALISAKAMLEKAAGVG